MSLGLSFPTFWGVGRMLCSDLLLGWEQERKCQVCIECPVKYCQQTLQPRQPGLKGPF